MELGLLLGLLLVPEYLYLPQEFSYTLGKQSVQVSRLFGYVFSHLFACANKILQFLSVHTYR